MVNSLYSALSEVCLSFYRLYFLHQEIASTIDKYLRQYKCQNIFFFGGLLNAASLLNEKGYKITFVDYSKEIVSQAKKVLHDSDFVISDMRTLNLKEKHDAIVLIGRIFTYMYTNEDARKALIAFKNNLRGGGIVLFDNYETGKIDADNYFNGTVEVKKDSRSVKRISTMTKKQEAPALYRWDCIYEEEMNGNKNTYKDNNHVLRGFTKKEIQKLVEESGLEFIEHRANFEQRSFVTVARKMYQQ